MISQILLAAAVAVFMIGTFLSLGGVSYAGGGSPAGDQYGQPAGVLTTSGQPSGQTGQAGAGTLPNTGLSLLVTFVAGVSLIGAGLLVRRHGRQAHAEPADSSD